MHSFTGTLTYTSSTGWPNNNRMFLRYHIFAAMTVMVTLFVTEVFRNRNKKKTTDSF